MKKIEKNNKTKVFAIVLSMVMALSVFLQTEVYAQGEDYSVNKAVDSYVTKNIGDFECVIDGNCVSIWHYNGKAKDLIIPDTLKGYKVTRIYNLIRTDGKKNNFKTIKIPASIEYVVDGTFSGEEITRIDVASGNKNYSSLDGVLYNKKGTEILQFPKGKSGSHKISAAVNNIKATDFAGCKKLTKIYVASGNKKYCSKDGVLFNKKCTEVLRCPEGRTGSYKIPDSVKVIGENAFSGCSRLTKIKTNDSIVKISSEAFNNCKGLSGVDIPESVREIGRGAFYGCEGFKQIDIPNHITQIGNFTFGRCKGLKSVNIPSNVTDIGMAAFYECTELKNINIPSKVKFISYDVFCYCSNLKKITVESGNKYFKSIDGVLYDKKGTKLLECPEGKRGTLRISSKVEQIQIIRDKLSRIEVESGNKNYCSINGVLFNKKGTELIKCPGEKTGNYKVPNKVTTINTWAFWGCSNLKSVEIGKKVNIMYSTFDECKNVVIRCYKGSVAYNYAIQNKMKYKLL